MTKECLASINALAKEHGITQAEAFNRLAAFFFSLEDQAAQAFALGLAPSWARDSARERFKKAIEKIVK